MRVFCLWICVLLALFGCSKEGSDPAVLAYFADNGKIKVLSTTAMIDDLVGEIGGQWIDHLPLVSCGLDPHSYELVKGDDEKIAYADLVIGNGLNLEHGASLRYRLEHHDGALYLGDEIRNRFPTEILVVDGELDPHIWMDISLWAKGVDVIVSALSEADGDHAADYRKNGDLLRQKMLLAHRDVQQQLAAVDPKARYLVTSHDAFHYFTRAYLSDGEEWEVRCVAPEGLAPDGQLGAQDIKRVVDHLSTYGIGVVFPESNVNRDALRKIVSSCNHPVAISTQALYGDAMGAPGSGADTYLAMIQHNAKVLREEWQAHSRLKN